MTAIIIEDETLIAKELKSKIAKVDPELEIKEILPSVKTAKKWLMEHAEPDLIFADIQLSDGVSFEIFERYELKCPIIFTTAYDEYAIQAFKVNGIDYLLKPVDLSDLQKAIAKSKQQIDSKHQMPNNIDELIKLLQFPTKQTKVYKEKFIVNIRNTWVPIDIKDIACFVRENLYYLYTFAGEKYMLDYNSLDEIEELINPLHFYRVNRTCIIHINAIQSIKSLANQKLEINLLPAIKLTQDMSREKAPAFKKWLER